MKAAIYARFSSDLQKERSIDDQIALCRAYADRHDIRIVETYQDRAVSGASTAQRHGWQQLMADAGDRRFDVIIAEDVDRIARSEADYHEARRRLTFLGIEVHTATSGPISGIEGSVRAMMAAHFLENQAHKIRRGMSGRVRQGLAGGGLTYGYAPVAGDPGRRVIIEYEAAIVRRIFLAFAEGNSPREIAGALNRDGIASPAAAGGMPRPLRDRGNGAPVYSTTSSIAGAWSGIGST